MTLDMFFQVMLMTETFITFGFLAVKWLGGCVTAHMLIQLTFECKCTFAYFTLELTVLVGVGMKLIQSRSEENFSTDFAL